MAWINRTLTDEESPEAKLLRQRLLYIGLLFVFAAVAGLMPIYNDWELTPLAAVIVAVCGFVLIIIDRIDTWFGLKAAAASTIANTTVVNQTSSPAPVVSEGSTPPTFAPGIPDRPGASG